MGALGFDEGSQERGATYVGCCTAATVIHTTPMGHDQEGGNEERESLAEWDWERKTSYQM